MIFSCCKNFLCFVLQTPSPPTTILGIPSNLLTPELLRTRSTSESSSTLLSPLKLSGSVQTGQGQAVGKRPDPLLQRGAPSLLTKEQLAATLTHLLNVSLISGYSWKWKLGCQWHTIINEKILMTINWTWKVTPNGQELIGFGVGLVLWQGYEGSTLKQNTKMFDYLTC